MIRYNSCVDYACVNNEASSINTKTSLFTELASIWLNFSVMNLTLPLASDYTFTMENETCVDCWMSLTLFLLKHCITMTLKALKHEKFYPAHEAVYVVLFLIWSVNHKNLTSYSSFLQVRNKLLYLRLLFILKSKMLNLLTNGTFRNMQLSMNVVL